MTTLGPGGDGSPVTAREMYSIMNTVKGEILNEVRQVNEKMDKRFDVHRIEHEREKDHRASLSRWAVTSLISGTGVLLALYVSFKGGVN